MNLYSGFESGIQFDSPESSVQDSRPQSVLEIFSVDSSIELPVDPDEMYRRTVGELLANYEGDAIFKNSEVTHHMRVVSLDIKKSIAGAVIITGMVRSAQKPGYYAKKYASSSRSARKNTVQGKEEYKFTIRVYNKGDFPFQAHHPCEVRCECPAFQYFLAYPDWSNKNLWGSPSKWHKTPYIGSGPRKRNPGYTPGLCKHLAAVIWELETKYPKQYFR